MNRAKVQVEDAALQPHVSDPSRSSRRRWVVGLLAAVVVASAAGFAALATNQDQDPASPTPAPVQDSAAAADLAAAQGLADAFVAHDADAAASYLAPGVELWEGWRRHFERDAAWSVDAVMEPCVEGPSSTVGTFTCPFAMDLQGSDEVGSGPFLDNVLSIRVADGEVISADREIPYSTNGVGKHLDAVFTWIEANHPDHVAFLGKDELEVADGRWPAWLDLWKRDLADYVAANAAG